MPIRIRIVHLVLKVQPVRPKVTATTTKLCITPIKRLQQRRRCRPVIGIAIIRKRRRRAHAQCVRNLVERCPLRHVRAIRAKADIAVATAVGGRDARVVFDCEGLGGLGAQGLVPCDGGVHGGGYLGVGICLVGGGT